MSQQEVESFLASYDPEVRDLAMKIRALIQDVAPGVTEKVYTGWKNIGYAAGGTMKDQFCYISPHKSDVRLGFNQGAALPDPQGMLEGSGKKMRHIKLRSAEDVEKPEVRRLIKAAADHAQAS